MTAPILGPIGPLANHARTYAEAGWPIFPAHPRTKAPLTPNGLYDATADLDQIERWWTAYPDALIAHRIPPGVLILDVDPRHGGAHTLNGIKEHIPLPVTRRHISGRNDGGGHLWFRMPPGKLTTRPLTEWARAHGYGHEADHGRWSTGIDLLHHLLRYTILPPSPHPDTGEPYHWRDEGMHTPVVAMPTALALLVTETDTPTPPRPPRGPADPDSIADHYTDTTSWNEVLAPHGWTVVRGDGDGDGSAWRHPTATAASSATISYGHLFVYSTNTPFEPTEPGNPHGYTRFAAYAVLGHGGDMAAAARAIRARITPRNAAYDDGWLDGVPRASGRRREPTGDPDDPSGEPDPDAGPDEGGEPWAEPIPFTVHPDPPPWPVEVFPPWLADHVTGVAGTLQVPVDLCAQLAVGVLAAAAMGHVNVQITDTWTEPPVLYLATVMPSGAGKSPADKQMTAPLRTLQTDLIEATRKERGEAWARKDIANQRAKTAATVAAKQGTERAIADALRAQVAADEIEPPHEPRLLVSDVTPEALAQVMADHGGRIAIVSTEAELYDLVLGAYSARPNLGVLLKGWSGDELVIDRKGGSGTPGTAIHIPTALLTISITVQPSALFALAGKPELTSRGFVPRFMHALPTSLVGTRDYLCERAPITTTADYTARVVALGRRLATHVTPEPLVFAADALRGFLTWRQGLEARIGPQGDLAHLGEYVSKLTGSVVRLAGLLHLADGGPVPGEVDAGTVTRALTVGDYWLAHADLLHARWRTDVSERDDAMTVLAWAAAHGEPFSRRDIHRAHQSRFTGADDVQPVLDRLVDHGWIRPFGLRPRGPRDKGAAVLYVTHPDANGCG